MTRFEYLLILKNYSINRYYSPLIFNIAKRILFLDCIQLLYKQSMLGKIKYKILHNTDVLT